MQELTGPFVVCGLGFGAQTGLLVVLYARAPLAAFLSPAVGVWVGFVYTTLPIAMTLTSLLNGRRIRRLQ